MKYSGAVEGAFTSRIQDIPLGQEKLQRTRLGLRQPIADRPHGFELSGCSAALSAPRSKVDSPISLFEAHAGIEVWQMEGKSCPPNGYWVVGVQREEPYPRYTIEVNVRAHVYLVRLAQEGKRWRNHRSYTPHGEGCDADPGRTVERVDGQGFRD